jgi:hypothetical protein
VELRFRCLLALLDEAIEGNKLLFVKAEDHARDAVAGKACANLPQAISDRPCEQHADRPTMLHTLEIPTYGKTVSLWEIL